MKKKITRRSFITKSANMGAASLVGCTWISSMGCGSRPAPVPDADISVAQGTDWYKAAKRSVEKLGGMERFVKKGAKVCILPNVQKNNPGVFTKPEITRAVIDMCKAAGAGEINCLSWLPRKHWDSMEMSKVVEEAGAKLLIADLKNEDLFKPMPIAQGVKLKEARIMELFFDNDVFINMPIVKDHSGNRFTGTLKNLMGLNSPKSNRTFHTGNFKNDDIGHLDQCIADLNLVVKPDLCVVDATEFIVTNGPFGPGELKKPQKVVAGTDRVAIDAYCAGLWGLEPKEIIMIQKAHEHGIGDMDLNKKKVIETPV